MWTHIAVIRSLARKVHTHIHTHNFGVLDELSWSREEYVRTEVQNSDLSERIWQIKKEDRERSSKFGMLSEMVKLVSWQREEQIWRKSEHLK